LGIFFIKKFFFFSNIGVSHLNIISDSPSNQYRNKSIFWFIKEYAEKKELSIKWIFLEAGHGKSVFLLSSPTIICANN